MAVYAAITGGIFVFALITLLLGAAGAHQDNIKRRVSGIFSDMQKAAILDEELTRPLSERLLKPMVKALSAQLGKLMSKNRSSRKKTGRQSGEKTKRMLRQAGFSIGVGEYTLLRLFVLTGAGVSGGLLTMFLSHADKALYGALFGVFAGYAMLRFHLTSAISGRRKSMEEQMPDVLDLLSINVEAGLGFEQALLHVIEHFEGPLIDELTITYREMTMGRTRREALTFFGDRCDISEIKTFASAIVQAETLGISIKNILRTQASAMRTGRRNKVEEKAQKISVKIILPMVGLIFPVLLIVLMGPAAMKIATQFMK